LYAREPTATLGGRWGEFARDPQEESRVFFGVGAPERPLAQAKQQGRGFLTMKRLLIVTAMALMLVGIAVPAAFGQTGIVIPLDTVVRAAPGSLTVLAVVDTPSDLVGSTCQGLGVTQNQDSVHPNNDIIME
jgi:hypothetical protein